MGRLLPHIGLRTVKTGLAVVLALFLADLRASPLPIFAAIGAIVAMNRTVGDAFESCRTQFFGILLGAGFGALFVNLFEGLRYVGIGLGMMALILLCVSLRLRFAVPLACIVFSAVCLSPADQALYYGVNRLLDTSIGLATALAVNIALKPYNNYGQIVRLLRHFRQAVPAYVEERVLHGRYPDLSPLEQQLHRIAEELALFEKQYVLRPQGRTEQAVFLRGCEQLARSVYQELAALCAMDERGCLSPENAARLAVLGLTAPEGMAVPPRRDADVVGNYHLDNLLRACTFFDEFDAAQQPAAGQEK
ncbi:FUSC family protein [Agathobaculum desmolans]|uniref:FUSC family protein n=1 Tax=Agathobaculum desmolans TaxID=39484 RepID=UPI00248D6C08|nr:aromatic acid exporter family protein [Agathobaculum desmolans]